MSEIFRRAVQYQSRASRTSSVVLVSIILLMKIAIEGCCHGALDAIYRHIETLEARNNYLVDLLLICGDFQAIRNHRDLQCMAVPQKYRELGDFHKYYTGEKTAPVLTIVIGGNHEASNYFWELYHGGWLAPNIYFLGHAGCIQVDGLRIAGASGIFKRNDFHQGHYEQVPYDHGSMRSIYHIREYNIRRLSLLNSPHIFLSHDWPQSIEQHGDVQGLLRRKPFFHQDVNTGNLGSPPLMGLLQTLRPQWWFSAHLHVRFEAVVYHGQLPGSEANAPLAVQNPDEIAIVDDDFDTDTTNGPSVEPRNPDEITLDEEEDNVVDAPSVCTQPSETKFLALDKCLPRRDFLEVIDIPASDSFPPSASSSRRRPRLTYDPEWLAITRAFHPYLSTSRRQAVYPDEATARAKIKEELLWVEKNVQPKTLVDDTALLPGMRDIEDCQVFVQTAPGPGSEGGETMQQPPWYTNPQTVAFCEMLEVENKINPPPS
ncbi:lariat debranching enzyme, C-terminal domain-containing protein [Hygrophoropsis aurantiaca]|uniref:Lariat debranching enzyme, C-terminal domain-containing protein n=1 Tax=Hygrophoropsis aurantiaca TaxID=72124 RepID=A0ACB8AIZ7_9AGAM|nr:lariat debranching enzyme, C-terminal domain-containing protein [Hygrophoropsis aurantiaca]